MAAPPSYDQAAMYPDQATPYPPPAAPYPTTENQTQSGFPQSVFMPPMGQPGQGPPPMPPPVHAVGAFGAQNVLYDDGSKSGEPVSGGAGYTPVPTHDAEHSRADDGPKEESTIGLTSDNDWAGNSFSDKAIRRAFIRKVYLILTTQLLVTVAFVAFFLCHEPTKRWIQGDGFWFYYVSYATFLVTYITLICCASVRRSYPGNFICLAIFTLAFSYMTGTISSFYNTESVLIAAAITALVCLSITLFAIQTKIDFTMCTGLLFCLCMVLFFFGISCMIVTLVWGYSHILQCVYGALAALLFSMFLAYDTQMLIGGRKHQLSEEEHVFAALQLYLDVVYLFLIILSLFGGKN